MPIADRIVSTLRNLLRRDRVEQELDAELRAYVDLLAHEKIAAGMSPDAARRAALIETGGVAQVKEEVRDSRNGAFVDGVVRDIRYGARSLARTPGFTIAAALALALGIGANAAVFSVADAVILKPLAYRDPDALVTVLHRGRDPVAPANFVDWRRASTSFSGVGAAEVWEPNLTGSDRPEKVHALRLTNDIFPILGVAPLLGRFFLPEEQERGRDRVAVLGYGLWQRRFAGDPRVVGRVVMLDGDAFTVIGVMPRGFQFAPFWATDAELWSPLAFGDRITSRGGQSLRIFARLKTGVTLDRARAEMRAITARLEAEYPGSNRDVQVTPLKERVVGEVRTPLLVLLGAVTFVLLIACANVAHMLLARGAARQREIAVRIALGALRPRLFRQFLTESVLLAMLGGAGGLLLAVAGNRALLALSPANLPRIESVGVDGRVLAFLLLVALATGLGFGIAPALHASAGRVSETMRDGARGASDGWRRNRLRGILVASEFALALMLLIGAGLMIRSVAALETIDPGFTAHGVISMTVSVTGSAESPAARRANFYATMVERVRAIPGVVSAGAINHLPLAGDVWGLAYAVEGRPRPLPGDAPTAVYRIVMPGYFATMRIPIVRGRDIAAADDSTAPRAVVINQRFAELRWPGEDAIGKRITLDVRSDSAPAWLTVVGVSKNDARSEWNEAPQEEMFLSLAQTANTRAGPPSYITLVARTTGDAASLAPVVRDAIWSVARDVTLADVQTMEHVVGEATARPRFYLLLLVTFAAVALLLAAVGIYGVMAYAVSRRTNEIGIRMALGATARDVMRLVVGQSMRIALGGAVAGVAGAFALTRLMATLLYGVTPRDPVTFVGAALLLGIVALVASYIPARRATRIAPVSALRSD